VPESGEAIRSSIRRTALLLFVVACIGVTATGCRLSGLAFQKDESFKIFSPRQDSTVSLPVTLHWQRRSLSAGERYAVFVDRAPVAPGDPLSSIVNEDDPCRFTQTCATKLFLESRNVYRTAAPRLVIESIATTDELSRSNARDTHEAVIVVIDARNRRIGEKSYAVDFRIRRGSGQAAVARLWSSRG
jgi:hypothetical protein